MQKRLKHELANVHQVAKTQAQAQAEQFDEQQEALKLLKRTHQVCKTKPTPIRAMHKYGQARKAGAAKWLHCS